jgi:Trypsin-co-occurring domain 2
MAEGFELAEYIQRLRDELVTAWLRGRQSPVGFEVGPVELELSINAERTAEAKGGVRFWVVDAGVGGNATAGSAQRVKLSLSPRDRTDPTRPLFIRGAEVQDED